MAGDPSFANQAQTYPDLFAGEFPRVTIDAVIISGQNLVAGAVLGVITASGKYTLSLSASVDGSEVPRAILAKDVDASAGDKEGPAYLTGEFDEAALTFGTAHTADSTRVALAEKGIFLKTTVAA